MNQCIVNVDSLTTISVKEVYFCSIQASTQEVSLSGRTLPALAIVSNQS